MNNEAGFAAGAHHLKISLKDFSDGIYFARLKTNEGSETRKLIKQ
jgi:hypothetical protein